MSNWYICIIIKLHMFIMYTRLCKLLWFRV